MSAVSKQQQRLMGIVRALQTGAMKPGKASKQAQAMAKSMKKSDVKDFASTKHKGLPKKVKKEEMTLEIPKMYMVRKPMEGLTAEKMVCEINPLEGIQPLNIEMTDVHSVHATPEDAQAIAAEAYQKYCDEAIALEEKKDATSGKIKKAIDQLEKKRKEHLTLAKDDPKSASKHKEHIAKIATQIDDLMTKLERIEKSKKEIKKDEDKKESKLHENEEPGLNDVLSKEELINRLNNVFNDESINSLSFFQKVALTAVKKQIISKINAGKIQTRADLKAALQNP